MNFKDQSLDELLVQHEELSKQLFALRNEQKETGKLERPHEVKATRKNIARVLTVIREKRVEA